MAELHYYAQRRVIDNDSPVQQQNSQQFGTRRQMERQYCLFRANALEGETQAYDIIQMEWGTVETGSVEKIVYIKPETEPTPEVVEEPGEPEVTPGEGE